MGVKGIPMEMCTFFCDMSIRLCVSEHSMIVIIKGTRTETRTRAKKKKKAKNKKCKISKNSIRFIGSNLLNPDHYCLPHAPLLHVSLNCNRDRSEAS